MVALEQVGVGPLRACSKWAGALLGSRGPAPLGDQGPLLDLAGAELGDQPVELLLSAREHLELLGPQEQPVGHTPGAGKRRREKKSGRSGLDRRKSRGMGTEQPGGQGSPVHDNGPPSVAHLYFAEWCSWCATATRLR